MPWLHTTSPSWTRAADIPGNVALHRELLQVGGEVVEVPLGLGHQPAEGEHER